jgi:hypothetical protein
MEKRLLTLKKKHGNDLDAAKKKIADQEKKD